MNADKRKFMEEATRLAIESVEKGWGGPFGAVIVKDGEIIGRGQNRVLLTGCPVYHAEITAIIDATARLNPKPLLGSDYGAGTTLEMIPREVGSPDPVPERARMLKGCDIYSNGAPCPMCMSAIYWARIDHVYFAASLEDTRAIGFDDAFQYEDFALPWAKRRIAVTENFEREIGLKAYRAWHQFQQGTNAKGWLLTILRHAFINEYRRRTRHPETVDLDTIEPYSVFEQLQDEDPQRTFFDRIVDDEVLRAIDELPEQFRETVVLSDVEGLSYEEIARMLDVPVGTVKSRLFRARRLLQRRLYDYAVGMGYIKGNTA